MTQNEPVNLLENSALRIGTVIGVAILVIGIIGGIVGFAVSESIWRTNISRDIKQLEGQVLQLRSEIKDNQDEILSDRWTATDMRLWATELGKSNPELEIPESDRIRIRRVFGAKK